MTVKEIIELMTETSEIHLWKDGNHIATADGKDTIPEEYRRAKVRSIETGHFFINIEI